MLSGGQRQRLAIARALANEPTLVLADEPTGALDSEGGEEVLELFRRLHQGGQTILMVTHDQPVADAASRIVRMKDGRVVDDGDDGDRPERRDGREQMGGGDRAVGRGRVAAARLGWRCPAIALLVALAGGARHSAGGRRPPRRHRVRAFHEATGEPNLVAQVDLGGAERPRRRDR